MTAFFLVVMFICTALAVDIGMRNDLLARDQHAIDAATLAAVRRVNVAGVPGETLAQAIHAATDLAKEMIWQNTGLDRALWASCTDDSHLADVDPSQGGNCISFGLNSEGDRVARIILPSHAVHAIFGSPGGFDEYQLAALANADGNGCNGADDPNCAANTTTTTTTAPTSSSSSTSTSTTTVEQLCALYPDWFLLWDSVWDQCHYFRPGVDRTNLLAEFCTVGVHQVTVNGVPVTGNYFTFTELDLYVYWAYSPCNQIPGYGTARASYLQNNCTGNLISIVFTNYSVYISCQQYLPPGDTWESHNTTTTAAPTSSTSSTSSTTSAPPTTVATTTTEFDLS